MSTANLDVLESTLQKTHIWINDIAEELHGTERQAYTALRAVLHAIRDRLQPGEVVHLGAQLPLLIAGIYYDGWKYREKPLKMNREELFDRIAQAFRNDPGLDPSRAFQAVFRVLERKISEGEMQDVKHNLPKEIQDLWPAQDPF